MSCVVQWISSQEHREYVASRPSVSFLQVPEWGAVKPGWTARSVGWFANQQLIGAGLVLGRRIPRTKKWLAYLPEGPDLPWETEPERVGTEYLPALLTRLKASGAFLAKIGPTVPVKRWSTETLKAQLGQPGIDRLADIEPTSTNPAGTRLIAVLREQGWVQRPQTGAGFGDIQPRYVFQLPLQDAVGRPFAEAELLKHFNQLWRRNIRKSEKAGVVVAKGTREDLARFHPVYVETAVRDGFVPRGLAYFETMWDALNALGSPARMALHLAILGDRVLAATTTVSVGEHVWYSYGASANEGRDVRPSNAIQWEMMRAALGAGAKVYDMRGITDTANSADPHFGLLRFKLGTGGEAVEYVGEWDYPLRPGIAKAFDIYLRRSEIRRRIGRRPRRDPASVANTKLEARA